MGIRMLKGPGKIYKGGAKGVGRTRATIKRGKKKAGSAKRRVGKIRKIYQKGKKGILGAKKFIKKAAGYGKAIKAGAEAGAEVAGSLG